MSLLYNVLDKLRDIAAKDSKTDVSEAIKSAQTTESEFKRNVRLVKESTDDVIEAGIQQILSGDLDIYIARSDYNSPLGRFLQDMYDDIANSDYGLHPDDDFEQIESIMMDRLEADYGVQEAAHDTGCTCESCCVNEDQLDRELDGEEKDDDFFDRQPTRGKNAPPPATTISVGDIYYNGKVVASGVEGTKKDYRVVAKKLGLPSIVGLSWSKTGDKLPPAPPSDIRKYGLEESKRHPEFAAARKLNEGFERKVKRMVNEAVTANVSPDNNVSITANGTNTAEEADAISAILRNAGIVNKDPVSSIDPMGAGAMSSGFAPVDVAPMEPEMTGSDLEVAPFGGDLNGPTDDIAPEVGLNTPDYADGVDDFGVDYSIDADDGLEGDDMALPSDGDMDTSIDVVGSTDGLGDGTDAFDDEEEIAHESVMSEWANSKNGDAEERGNYKDDIYMLKTLAGGLNGPKKHMNVNNPGDNSMNKDTPTDGGMHDQAVIKTESKREAALKADAAKLEEELLLAFRNFK